MLPPSPPRTDLLLDMQATDLGAAEEALVMFRYKVRRALRDQQGYECQEADGDFMLAFISPADAVRFCLSVCLFCHVGVLFDFPVNLSFRFCCCPFTKSYITFLLL